MKYTKIEIDLDRCSLSTIIQIWLYSKPQDRAKQLRIICRKFCKLELEGKCIKKELNK